MTTLLTFGNGARIEARSAQNLRRWLDGVQLTGIQLRALLDIGHLVDTPRGIEINPRLLPEFLVRFPSGRRT